MDVRHVKLVKRNLPGDRELTVAVDLILVNAEARRLPLDAAIAKALAAGPSMRQRWNTR
jgi:hypothetical protein